MIKANKGEVEIKGPGDEIILELTTIIHALLYGEELQTKYMLVDAIKRAVKMGVDDIDINDESAIDRIFGVEVDDDEPLLS